MLRRFLYLLLMAGLLLIGAFSVLSSSSTEPLFTYVGERIARNETIWSPDSESLVFTDDLYGERTFYQYDLQTNHLQELERSPRRMQLTEQQQQLLNAVDDLAYVSPDGRYVVYLHHEQACNRDRFGNEILKCWYTTALGNLASGESVIIDRGKVDTGRWIIWSDNSEALLLVTSGTGIAIVRHITGYSDRVGHARTSWLMNMHSGNEAHVDMSADGQRVLLREQFDGHYTGLYVWHSDAPLPEEGYAASDSPLIFEDEVVKGAAFLPGSDDIIAVTDAGIVRLDMQSGERSVVNPRIHAGWVEWAYFSPDGQYIAVLDHGTNPGDSYGKCRLFVLPAEFAGDVEAMRAGTERCVFYA